MTLIMMAEGGADSCEMEMFSPPRGGNAALNDLVSHLAQVSHRAPHSQFRKTKEVRKNT